MSSLMSLALLQSLPIDTAGLPSFAVIGALFAVLVLVGLSAMFVSRYKRCPANRVLVISRQGRRRQGGALHLRRRRLRVAADPGLRLPLPRADPDRNPAQGRAVDREHPRQRAERVHRRHRHRAGGAAERGHPPARPARTTQIKQQAQDIIFGQLRQVIASMKIEDINRDRDKFLHKHPDVARAGAEEDRPRADQREHHRHHRRVGLHRGDRPQGGVAGGAAGARRRGRAGEAGRDRRGRGRAREGGPGGQRASSCARSARARRSASRRCASPSWTRSRRSASRRRRSSARRRSRRRSAQQAVRIAELDKEQKVGEQTAVFEREAQVKEAEQQQAHRRRRRQRQGDRRRGRRRRRRSPPRRPQLQVKQAEAYQLAETRKREAEAAVSGSAEPRAGPGRARRGRARRGRAARRARGAGQGREGAHDRRGRGRGREPPHRAPRPRRARSSRSSRPRRAASTRSWRRRARRSKQLVEACGGAKEAFQLLMLEHLDTLAETCGQGDLEHQVRQGRRVGRRPAATAATRRASCRAWRARCRR